MKITVHLEGKNGAELAQGLRAHLALLEGGTTAATTATTTTKTGKKTAKAPVETEEEEEDFDLTSGEDEEELDMDGADEADADAEEEEEAEEATSLEDVIGAFQKYAKKHSREKAAKVLATFKAKSVRDLKAAQYDKVLAALKK